ncbi:PQQ-binding-like beta-propeller repeat protein [Brevibacillus sp. NPDC003359]|uniref:outer membrane protein assembly factor BamB family protein n=1 Tax=unclassified Brevibacillus TaxID=2684853 RepID=UPI0036A199F1
MKKLMKSMVVLTLTMGVAFSNVHPMFDQSVVAAESLQFRPGSGYVDGVYKADAIHPAGVNWNRNSPYTGGDTPSVNWSFQLGNDKVHEEQIHSLPAIDADGTIYVVGTSGKYLAAISKEGVKKWEAQLDGTPVGAPVIGADGTIYVTSYDNDKVYAFTAEGSLKWDYEISGKVKGSVALGNQGSIYVAGEDRKLHALSAKGEELWATSLDGKVHGTPILAEDGTIYIGTLNGALHAINADGSIQWIKLNPGAISFSAPTIGTDGSLYFGHSKYRTTGITKNGELKWAVGTGAQIEYSSPVVTDQTMYIVGATKLMAFDLSGKEKWSVTHHEIDLHNGVIIDANGVIYATSMEGRLLAYNSTDGSLKWQIGLSKDELTAPILSSDGTIFVMDTTGRLFAVDTKGQLNSEPENKVGVFDLKADVTQTRVGLSWKDSGTPDYVKVTSLRYNQKESSYQTKGTSFSFDGLRKYTVYTFEVVPYKNDIAGIPAYVTLTTEDLDELTATADITYADYTDASNRTLLVKVKSNTKENYVVVKDKSLGFKVVQRIPVVNGEAKVTFDKEGTYDISAEAISERTGNSHFSQTFWLTVEFNNAPITKPSDPTSGGNTNGKGVVSVSEEGPNIVLTASLPEPGRGERIVYRFYNAAGTLVGSASGKAEDGMSLGKVVKGKHLLPSGNYKVKANYMKGFKTIDVIESDFSFDVTSLGEEANVRVEVKGKNYEITASVPSVSGEKISFRFYTDKGKLVGSVNSKTVNGQAVGILKKNTNQFLKGTYKAMTVYSVNGKVIRVSESDFTL